MDSITLQNYRCFGSGEQTARLAPLTLLVGPNSTGKTSFLALVRALWDVAFRDVIPNFHESPYDLGSFEDIVYRRGGRTGQASCFAGSFEYRPPLPEPDEFIRFGTVFENRQTAPFPILRAYSGTKVDVQMPTSETIDGQPPQYRIGKGPWQDLGKSAVVSFGGGLVPLEVLRWMPMSMDEHDRDAWEHFLGFIRNQKNFAPRPFASAPTRSRPLRTYNPTLLAHDSEGDYIPSYLSHLSRNDSYRWQIMKDRIEEFGSHSGLFDEITVRSFGRSDSDPFQIQVRKHSGPKSRRRKGLWRNFADVGYGVSQVLPVLTELFRLDGTQKFLLQQPEVHLHPQAQAALGTLFCQVATGGRQLVIETHSDYIIDRVRMDVRDGTTGLKPEDVSILYFEPGDLSVKIHSIRLDDMGNVLDAPPGYRQFFMEEIRRSIGL